MVFVASLVTLWAMSRSRTITVTVGADGQARLYGVPLGRGVVRSAVFWTLCRGTRADIHVALPYKVNMTNTIEILQAMNKAEWTNRHPERPNPYE
jgi:hypothetical protein